MSRHPKLLAETNQSPNKSVFIFQLEDCDCGPNTTRHLYLGYRLIHNYLVTSSLTVTTLNNIWIILMYSAYVVK